VKERERDIIKRERGGKKREGKRES